jgi:hypothetical protein
LKNKQIDVTENFFEIDTIEKNIKKLIIYWFDEKDKFKIIKSIDIYLFKTILIDLSILFFESPFEISVKNIWDIEEEEINENEKNFNLEKIETEYFYEKELSNVYEEYKHYKYFNEEKLIEIFKSNFDYENYLEKKKIIDDEKNYINNPYVVYNFNFENYINLPTKQFYFNPIDLIKNPNVNPYSIFSIFEKNQFNSYVKLENFEKKEFDNEYVFEREQNKIEDVNEKK